MKFAALIEYVPDREKIKAASKAHHTYMRGLLDSNRLFAAGPFTEDAGALWVYEAETLDEAEGLLRDDPLHAAGIFLTWKLCPLGYWSAKAFKGK